MSIEHGSFSDRLHARLQGMERSDVPIRINTPAELHEFHYQVGTRPDWHEPDEQELSAIVFGGNFDNAGFWARLELAYEIFEEMHVVFYVQGYPVAAVNLASLCSWGAAHGRSMAKSD